MDRRQRLADLAGARTNRDVHVAAAAAAMIPGVGVPIAAAISLAPLAINEVLHPIRSYHELKQDIFGIFGHRSHDAEANAQEARLRGNDYRLLSLMVAMFLPAVRTSKSVKIGKIWNGLVADLSHVPVAWADLGVLRKKVLSGVGKLAAALESIGVLPGGAGYAKKAAVIRAANMAAVQAMFRRDQGGHTVGWTVLGKAMASAMAGMAGLASSIRMSVHAPKTHATQVTQATHATQATKDAQVDAIRKQAAAAIEAAKALEARVAAGDAAERPAYASAYRRAQSLIIQTRTAQAAPVAAVAVAKKKSPVAMIGWLAVGAGVLDIARRIL